MKLHGKYYGSLFIALYLLSPLALFASVNQNSDYYRLSDACCVSAGANSAKPAQNHSHCKAHDNDVNDADSPCPCDMHSISFSFAYFPLTTPLEILETYKRLPNTFGSIFVPPQ
jgi:hypothetical protein